MTGHITRLDLRVRRRLIIGYAIGIAAYALFAIVAYHAFKRQSSLDQLNGFAVDILTGGMPIRSPPGWLSAYLYAYFVPLIQLLVTIGYGASCIAGQDEEGILGLVATLPLTRRVIAIDKLAALLVQAVVVPLVVALCVLGARGVGLTIARGPLLGITAGVILLGLLFGNLALLIGAITGSRGTALGISTAAGASAYLIAELAPSIDWLRPARYISPYFYAVGDKQIQHGLPITYAAILLAASLIFATAAVAAFERLDLR